MNNMWNSICKILENKSEIEIQTINKNGQPNLWISVKTSDNGIVISKAMHHIPSAVLKISRFIGEEEFMRVAEKYDSWRKGTENRCDIRRRCNKKCVNGQNMILCRRSKKWPTRRKSRI